MVDRRTYLRNESPSGRRLRIAVAGLGAIGAGVVCGIAVTEPNMEIVSVAEPDSRKVSELLREVDLHCDIRGLEDLHVGADIVVECLPSRLFDTVADSTLTAGKILMVLSSAALLQREDLLERAQSGQVRILVPSGAILGLDVVRAMKREGITSSKMVTRKPPISLADAPYFVGSNTVLENLQAPLRVFNGSAREAAKGFPANVNVVATLCLAGIGPDKTQCEIWAEPGRSNIEHVIEVQSANNRVSMSIVSQPSGSNARTSAIAALSVVDALRSLVETLRIGS